MRSFSAKMASNLRMRGTTTNTGPDLMMYGATGYTGRLASKYAKVLGLKVLLAGRDEVRVTRLAGELQFACCAFDLESDGADDYISSGLTAVLHCAGPFLETAKPLMEKCIKHGVHYLDISAELDSYRIAERLDQEAQAKGVMLLPGCGGSVAVLGCLTQHVLDHNSAPKPTRVDVALHVRGMMSRGSLISAASSKVTAATAWYGFVILSTGDGASGRSARASEAGPEAPVLCGRVRLFVTPADLRSVIRSGKVIGRHDSLPCPVLKSNCCGCSFIVQATSSSSRLWRCSAVEASSITQL